MKVRSGFVSNSSSSSFILKFDKKPECVGEVKDTLFPNDESFHYYDYNGHLCYGRTVLEVAEDIFNSMVPATQKSLLGLFNDRYAYDEALQNLGFRYGDKIDWYRVNIELEKIAKRQMREHLKVNTGKKLYIVSYSDEDGSFGSLMEHEVLGKCNSDVCRRFSNH